MASTTCLPNERCRRCGATMIRDDPHPACLKCSVSSGAPVCVRGYTCALCAGLPGEFWVRYMKRYYDRRSQLCVDALHKHDCIQVDSGKYVVPMSPPFTAMMTSEEYDTLCADKRMRRSVTSVRAKPRPAEGSGRSTSAAASVSDACSCQRMRDDPHPQCLKCTILSGRSVCIKSVTCAYCQNMSDDFWIRYSKRYSYFRYKLDDDSFRRHDQIMRDAGKVIRTNVAPALRMKTELNILAAKDNAKTSAALRKISTTSVTPRRTVTSMVTQRKVNFLNRNRRHIALAKQRTVQNTLQRDRCSCFGILGDRRPRVVVGRCHPLGIEEDGSSNRLCWTHREQIPNG